MAEMLKISSPGITPQVKWVNDIIVNGKKISGVLATAENEGGHCFMHLGMGININCSPMGDASTSLKEITKSESDIDLEPLVEQVATQLVSNHQLLKEQGFGPLKAKIEDTLLYKGQLV